jgi:hypothetical protein
LIHRSSSKFVRPQETVLSLLTSSARLTTVSTRSMGSGSRPRSWGLPLSHVLELACAGISGTSTGFAKAAYNRQPGNLKVSSSASFHSNLRLWLVKLCGCIWSDCLIPTIHNVLTR